MWRSAAVFTALALVLAGCAAQAPSGSMTSIDARLSPDLDTIAAYIRDADQRRVPGGVSGGIVGGVVGGVIGGSSSGSSGAIIGGAGGAVGASTSGGYLPQPGDFDDQDALLVATARSLDQELARLRPVSQAAARLTEERRVALGVGAPTPTPAAAQPTAITAAGIQQEFSAPADDIGAEIALATRARRGIGETAEIVAALVAETDQRLADAPQGAAATAEIARARDALAATREALEAQAAALGDAIEVAEAR